MIAKYVLCIVLVLRRGVVRFAYFGVSQRRKGAKVYVCFSGGSRQRRKGSRCSLFKARVLLMLKSVCCMRYAYFGVSPCLRLGKLRRKGAKVYMFCSGGSRQSRKGSRCSLFKARVLLMLKSVCCMRYAYFGVSQRRKGLYVLLRRLTPKSQRFALLTF